MALLALVKALVVGVHDARPLAEDAISAMRCFQVVNAERGEHYFVIEGWLPRPWVPEFRTVVEESSQGRVAVVVDEDVDAAVTTRPSALRNIPLARPYELLVELYGMPGRDDYDPTFATFLFMPLFFGLMIGDAGYGVALFAASWLIGRWFKTPLARLARSLLTFGGAWSIGFGLFLFGEVFGWSISPWVPGYPFVHRSGDLLTLFILAVVVGATHVNIGLLIGFRALKKRQGLRVAFLRKISWIILEQGVFILMIGMAGLALAEYWYVGIGIMAFAVGLIAWGGGLTDIVEVPSFVSNILSYLRLAVIGIAKSALAGAVNTIIVGSLFPLGIGGWIAGGFLLVIGHGFVLVLAVATVGIQALRLHYVEFYSKFYPREGLQIVEKFRPSVKAGSTGSRT